MAKGDGSVYLRGKVWYIRYWRNGQPITISCPRLTESQAKDRLKHELRKNDDQVVAPREKRTTIAELIKDLRDDYEARGRVDLSEYTERRWTLHLAPFFGKMKAHELGTKQQRDYRVARTKAKAAVATINREMQVLRNAFILASKCEPPKVRRVPAFLFVKEENVRTGFATVQQMARIKQEAAKFGVEYRVIIELACHLGWRLGELVNLRVRNVRLHDGGPYGCIRLEGTETKNKQPREVPLLPELRMFLEPLVTGREPEGRVFPSIKTTRYIWPKIAENAGVPGLLFHDLRRSVARTRRSAGIDSSIIMNMQGWRTDSMFRRYGVVAASDKLEALAVQMEYERRLLEPPTIEGNKAGTDTNP